MTICPTINDIQYSEFVIIRTIIDLGNVDVTKQFGFILLSPQGSEQAGDDWREYAADDGRTILSGPGPRGRSIPAQSSLIKEGVSKVMDGLLIVVGASARHIYDFR
jgi:hypothetical protein